MPIYEYVCGDCGAQFEEILSPSAPAPACPKCKSANTKKLMSCCRYSSGNADAGAAKTTARSSGGGCAGCSGGNCASCG